VAWSPEQAYGTYPQAEPEFSAALDESLHPHGPGQLLDLVAAMGLPPGAVALDVGCGEGCHALVLHQRFGFRVTGIDPVPRHIQAARAAAGQDGPAFGPGTAEDIPASPGTVDLVWCRDVLVHSPDLPRAYAEFRRVLRPGGRALVYQMFGTELLEPREAAGSSRLWAWSRQTPIPPAPRPQSARPGCASTSAWPSAPNGANGPRNSMGTVAGNSCTRRGCGATRPDTSTASAGPPTT